MDDGFLIRQVLSGKRDAFRLLVIRHQRPLFRFLGGFGLSQAVAEELAQESFLRAFRSLASYDDTRASFASWLFTIAKHLAIDAVARGRREVALPEPADDAAVAHDPSAHTLLEQAERRRRLRQTLARLPQVLRGTLALAYVKELSLDDIAAIEGCSVGTVKSRLFRGRQLLRAALAAGEE